MAIAVPKRTIQFLVRGQKGAARLSPDLVELGREFTAYADRRTKTLLLDSDRKAKGGTRLRVWASNERSKSGYIGLSDVLAQIGVDVEDLRGKEYAVRVRGGRIEVKLFREDDESSQSKDGDRRVGVSAS